MSKGPLWITDPDPPTPVEAMSEDQIIAEWQVRRNGIRGLVLAEEYMRRAVARRREKHGGEAEGVQAGPAAAGPVLG